MTFWVLAFDKRMTLNVFADDAPARIWTTTRATKTAAPSLFIFRGENSLTVHVLLRKLKLARDDVSYALPGGIASPSRGRGMVVGAANILWSWASMYRLFKRVIAAREDARPP